MNPILKFYSTVLTYLKAELKKEGQDDYYLYGALSLKDRSSVSWGFTMRRMYLLRQMQKEDTNFATTERSDFTQAAFKDLVVLRNPQAMRVFNDIRSQLRKEGEDFVWMPRIKSRKEGAAFVGVYTSNLDLFQRKLEGNDQGIVVTGNLESVLTIREIWGDI